MNNDTPADAMKPCPFCGGEQTAIAPYHDHEFGDVEWNIICKACGASVRRDLEAEAIAAWNTRTTSLAAQDGLVEALRFYAEEDRYDYDQTCCTFAATKKRRRELEKSGGWVLEDGGEKARAALASIEVKSS